MMHRARRIKRGRQWDEAALVLMAGRGIARVNAQFLGRPDSTDVISFTYPPGPASGDGYSGEILVNVERAWREGLRRRGPSHELALYIAHGCDHLAGFDDALPRERRAMRRRELRWLRACGILQRTLFEDEP